MQSAFSPYYREKTKSKVLIDDAKKIKTTRYEEFPTKPSIVTLATLGLESTYKGIKNKILRKPNNDRFSQSRWDGKMHFGDNPPLMGGRYKFISQIGEGTFSQLISAEDTFNKSKKTKYVAIKIMNAQFPEIGLHENRKLFQLNRADSNSNYPIIRLLNTFFFANHFCLVLELFESNLFEALQDLFFEGLPLEDLRRIALKLVTVLVFLEQQQIIHADLKPENILLRGHTISDSVIKVADFGNSLNFSQTSSYFDTFELQSLFYRAPEVVFGIPFGAAVDMWSVGCILVEAFTGSPLFSCKNVNELVSQMSGSLGEIPHSLFSSGKFYKEFFTEQKKLRLPLPPRPTLIRLLCKSRDSNFIDFIMGMLEYDPKLRMTPQQALFHPFMEPIFPFLSLLGPFMPSGFVSSMHAYQRVTIRRGKQSHDEDEDVDILSTDDTEVLSIKLPTKQEISNSNANKNESKPEVLHKHQPKNSPPKRLIDDREFLESLKRQKAEPTTETVPIVTEKDDEDVDILGDVEESEIIVSSPIPMQESKLEVENKVQTQISSISSSSSSENEQTSTFISPSILEAGGHLEDDLPTLLPHSPEDFTKSRKRKKNEIRRIQSITLKTDLNERELSSERSKRKQQREQKRSSVVFTREQNET